jgi:hypothetical protein
MAGVILLSSKNKEAPTTPKGTSTNGQDGGAAASAGCHSGVRQEIPQLAA